MSDNDIVITVDNLSKAYLLGREERSDTFFGSVGNIIKAPVRNLRRLKRLNTFNLREAEAVDSDDILWALKNISFTVKRGECIGIIGRNGAGKSTLLKILSRIAEPTRGRVVMHGRVSALLEVGTGFHPELTGRENIYLNGTILGMKKAEIDTKFDEIVDFSGVEKFLDTPVKRYSSGMRVRLAFSVAAHLEPEILIVDEVLAVGDADFQKKCLGKMQDVTSGEGRTVLFVSHNMGAVRNLCSRGILLRQGSQICDQPIDQTIKEYTSYLTATAEISLTEENKERGGDGRVRLIAVRCLNQNGATTAEIIAGETITFEFDYENCQKLSSIDVAMTVYNNLGIAVTSCNTNLQGQRINLHPEKGTFSCVFEDTPFPLGRYRLAIALQDGGNCDWLPNVIIFDVTGSNFFHSGKTPNPNYCNVMIRHSWKQHK